MENQEYNSFENYIEKYPSIKETIVLLRGNAFSNTNSYRAKYRKLKEIYNNCFDKDLDQQNDTDQTKLIKSALSRITVEVAKRLISFPEIDIEPVDASDFNVTAKNKANITKAALTWIMRVTNFAGIFQESKEEWMWAGDTARMPSVIINRKNKKKLRPIWEDVSPADLIVDPGCKNIHSESISKSANFVSHTAVYSRAGVISELGQWAMKYVQPGFMVDNKPYGNSDLTNAGGTNTQGVTFDNNTEYYERLRVFDRSTGREFILWGANAFPQVYNNETEFEEATAELSTLKKEGKIEWSKDYKWKDSDGNNIIPIYQNFCYRNPDWAYNRGMVERVSDLQNADEIIANLKFDNVRQLMDYIFYISGGNAAIIKNQIQEYRNARKVDRDAFLHLPSSLTGAVPQFGVLKPEGIDVNWANSTTQDINNISKNSTGINPQRQEIQKNTGVGQTEVLQEEKVDAMEEIVDDNIMEFQRELKGMIYFIVAYEGFGLNDVLINYDQYFVQEIGGKKEVFTNTNATISITEVAKQLADFEFTVTVDKSSIIKKSRFVEVQKITQVLGMLDPAATPERFKAALDALFKQIGVQLPKELPQENISAMKPTGGTSQFKTIDNSQQMDNMQA